MNAADPTSSPPRPGPACPRCHRPVPADALGDACPSCLLAAGFFSQTTAPAADHEPTIPIEALTPEFPALELLEQLGRGGMGAVYKARQRDLDRLVALKILRPGLDADPTFAARFAEEARALARLNHPGIVTLHEFGRTSAGRYFIVMEFVDGMNLRQLLAAGRIAPREALAIVPPLCDALQYAHDRGLVHRDIKPENILLDRLGRVKIADFGLARLATSPAEPADKVMGTPAYMAPEQRVHAAAVDHRADIYALGVVLYQMLTGELPARGALQPPSRRVQIDVRLDEIVLRALEADPARRYSAAGELKTEIETLSAPPPPSASPARSSLRLRIGVGITVSAVAAFALWITPPRTSDGKPAPSERQPGPPSVVISVSVQGAVARPAMYSLRPDATLLDAIAAAGGWTSGGDTSAILLTLAGSDHPEVHGLGAILHGEAVNPGLGAGATVFVPTRNR